MKQEEIALSLQRLLNLAKLDSVYVKSSLQTGLQATLLVRDPSLKIDEVILTCCLAAEKMCPGTFAKVLIRALELNHSNIKDVSKSSDVGVRAERSDVDYLLQHVVTEKFTHNVLMQALSLVGFTGKILIERSKDSRCVLQQITGCTFNLTQLTKKKEVVHNAKIVVIDGMIESVSEIHHLLTWLSEHKQPCVLFVRSISDDVLNTINVNNARRSLDVSVYRANFHIEHANTLVDVATVTSSRFISTLTGDLITSLNPEKDLGQADKVYIDLNVVTTVTPATVGQTLQHLSTLRKARENETTDIKQRVLDARIKSVTPSQVVIKLPDDNLFVYRSQQIDYALRTIKSAVDWGVKRDGQHISLAANDIIVNQYATRLLSLLREMIIV